MNFMHQEKNPLEKIEYRSKTAQDILQQLVDRGIDLEERAKLVERVYSSSVRTFRDHVAPLKFQHPEEFDSFKKHMDKLGKIFSQLELNMMALESDSVRGYIEEMISDALVPIYGLTEDYVKIKKILNSSKYGRTSTPNK